MASEGLWRPSQGAKSIIVKDLSGKATKLEEVDLSETIASVKAMVYEKEGCPPDAQRLVFNGVEARKDYCTLDEYGFQYGTDIYLILRLAGIPVWNRYLSNTSIDEVRYIIRKQEGIRQMQQHLVFCGLSLDNDRTLADYNIQENSTLHLAPGPLGGSSGLHEVA
ncbi:hypothetical protein BDA96_05G072000 [Sorghum bicolor]|uniref:Ubiquitin-like domain-containing protein n=1 Tax=Sorghum bicolor TaxID=4558 RepID=A0A921QWR0_SORBI|nr:hypothetical protein BDA96_05G072000 [Sorghum bicolor]